MSPRPTPAGLLAPLMPVLAVAAATIAAVLPRRHWERFEQLPIAATGWFSAMATAGLGLYLWANGVVAFVRGAADASAAATLDLAARQVAGAAPETPLLLSGPQMYTVAALVGFTLFTPAGLAATYLVFSAVARGVAVAACDPIGDPLLTAVDSLAVVVRARRRQAGARRARERAEGEATGDRLFTGEGAGLPGVDYVVVASRRKTDWTPGTIVIAADDWYRVGVPFDTTFSFGLRTAYPLTRMDKTEVLRKAVRYDFPPLLRGPGRLD